MDHSLHATKLRRHFSLRLTGFTGVVGRSLRLTDRYGSVTIDNIARLVAKPVCLYDVVVSGCLVVLFAISVSHLCCC